MSDYTISHQYFFLIPRKTEPLQFHNSFHF